MPRRKKKSTLERKPSLVFTESPVNIQNNVLTPVLCARHPPTASSVPIENLSNLSWVNVINMHAFNFKDKFSADYFFKTL